MAAVIGVPDPLRTEAVTAIIVPAPGITGDAALAAHCRSHVEIPACRPCLSAPGAVHRGAAADRHRQGDARRAAAPMTQRNPADARQHHHPQPRPRPRRGHRHAARQRARLRRCDASRRCAAEIDRHDRISPPICGRRWASSACSASRSARNTAAPVWATSPIASRWRRSAAPRASVGLSYGAHSNLCVNQITPQRAARSRSAAICRS